LNGGSLDNLGAGAIAALLAQGQNSATSLIQQPIAVFGGGKTLTGVVIPPLSFTANQASSWVRHLQSSTILAAQGKESTLRAGTRYPIVSSLYSTASVPSIPRSGTGLAQSQIQEQALPQFTYADLGVTLKATPTIHISGDVTLKISMQIESLGNQTINGVPVINNEQYEGSVTLKEGDMAVVAGALTKSNVQAIAGIPLVSLIPGLGPLASQTSKQTEDDSLLVLITPTLVRGSFPRSAEVWLPSEK